MRGGSWNNNPRNCRSANRNRNNPGNRNNNIGFRVACVAASTLLCQN
ncbi:SUMF1/EgtB/PvdO family nonheme iron enzyme [Lusitaniella coriacea]